MRRIGWLLAAVMTFSLAAPPAMAAYTLPDGPVFNIPRPWGTVAQQYAIVNTLEDAIRHVPGPTRKYPSPSITIATFLMDRAPGVDALIAACKRGVAVRVILDEDIENRNSRRLIQALNGDNVRDRNNDGKPDARPRTGRCGRALRNAAGRTTGDAVPPPLISRAEAVASVAAPTGNPTTWGKDGSYVKRCLGACRSGGKGGNVHSKFFLYSRTAGVDNVVMVSSSNLNRGGAMLGWNDLVVMKGQAKAFAFYQRIHRLMTAQKRAGTQRVQIVHGPYVSRFFPMRNAGRRNDPTLADINGIRCTGSAFGRTQIHISMFYWKGPRGQYLTDALLAKSRQGCAVSIIYGAPSIQIAARLREAARANRIRLYDSRWDFDEDGWNEVRTHAKYVLVKGRYRNNRRAQLVWTGSQNWVSGSLNLSDESTLNITSAGAYRAYLAHWERIRAHSRQLPGFASATQRPAV